MIKDEVRIVLKAGNGGNGASKFGRNGKYPQGGDGGKGGDVYIEGMTNIYDLNFINPGAEYKAESGESGGINRQRGKNGIDLIFKVPLITEIYDNNKKLLMVVDKPGEKILLAKGGEGGRGNYHFREGDDGNFAKTTAGEKGKMLYVNLVLKLKADIVFIGFPNAGKSSMLNALTNANVKVADYPFTTLSPHLGTLPGIKLMDLPGLIEGTSEGKGLGSNFIKHTEYAKLVAHFISLDSENVAESYEKMRRELENLSKNLAKKTEIIVLTKSDMLLPEGIKEKVNQLKVFNKRIIACSAYDPESVKEVEKVFREELRTLK